jgi:hypothetical protein
MYSMAYPLAVLATCVASANAFMATGPVLRASPAPAIARANRTPLKMEAAVEKKVIGALAEKYSGAIAHPATHADDSAIRKILPHRSVPTEIGKCELPGLRFLHMPLSARRGQVGCSLRMIFGHCAANSRPVSINCMQLDSAAELACAAVSII